MTLRSIVTYLDPLVARRNTLQAREPIGYPVMLCSWGRQAVGGGDKVAAGLPLATRTSEF